jgi:hypothetical protein
MNLLPPDHTRSPYPFGGWALHRAVRIDQTSSRGFAADLAAFSMLKRQSAFAVLGSIDPSDPTPFLARLGGPSRSFGEVIRVSQAWDLIAAAYEVEHVPSGYLRALTRINFKPLDEPHLYRRLFDIFTNEGERQKTNALRYCGPIDAIRIQVVDVLDPVLVHPEIVKHTRSIAQAQKANGMLRFLRGICSTATDELLAAGIRQAMGSGGLERFAQKAIQNADRFPPPPFPSHHDFIPLTTAAEMVRIGREMRHCLGSKVPQALLGMAAFYRTQVQVSGKAMPLVVEFAPLSNGTWTVEGIFGPGNTKPPPAVMRTLVRRLMELGAVVAMNPAVHPQAGELARSLRVWAWGEFQLMGLQDEPEEDPNPEDCLEAAVLDEALEAVEREFGFR